MYIRLTQTAYTGTSRASQQESVGAANARQSTFPTAPSLPVSPLLLGLVLLASAQDTHAPQSISKKQDNRLA